MWTCHVCAALVDNEDLASCWNCAAERQSTWSDSDQQGTSSGGSVGGGTGLFTVGLTLTCLRCPTATMIFNRTKQFKIASNDTFAEKVESYDVYSCPNCGKLEFYLAKVPKKKFSK